jgi:hypothetical protein
VAGSDEAADELREIRRVPEESEEIHDAWRRFRRASCLWAPGTAAPTAGSRWPGSQRCRSSR